MTVDTLVLGTAALIAAVFGPFLSDKVKRRFFAPKLKFLFDEETPQFIKTIFTSDKDPSLREDVYYFQFRITNEGATQARICEPVLEKLWTYDAGGSSHEFHNFRARNLGFDNFGPSAGINPHRTLTSSFGHISSPDFQANYENKVFVDLPGEWDDKLLRFALEGQTPNAVVNCLTPGKYTVQITLFSENASPVTGFFTIFWTGNWQGDSQAMFRECVIQFSNKKPT